MKKFLKYTLLFLAPIVVGLISMEFLLRNIPNDYSYKRQYLDKNANTIEVLFLGNSHIYFGIDPEYSKAKSFNASHISQSLNYDLAILEKYNTRWKSLKYIIIPVDYFSLYSRLENGVEKWRIKNYNLYYGIKQNASFSNSFEIVNGKFASNIERLKAYLIDKKSDITCNRLGFGTTYNSALEKNKDLDESGKIAAKRHTVDKNHLDFTKNKEIIDSIIEFSKKHNAKIIFITCPAYKTYVENLDAEQLNTTLEVIKQLSSKNLNTSYSNFLSDSSFVARDFFDADHLNEIGAKKLTLKIDSIINAIR